MKQGEVYLYTANGLTSAVKLIRPFMSKPEYWYAQTPFGTFTVCAEELKEVASEKVQSLHME